MQKVEKVKGSYNFSIQNVGGFAIPFDIKLTYADGSTENFHQTPIIWQNNQKQITIAIKTTKVIKSAIIDGGIFMDADESNNKWIEK